MPMISGGSTEERRGAVAAALSSVVAAVFLVTLKLAAGLVSGSLGVLSEAVHSGLDLAAAAVTFLAVRAAGKPADVDHHYGHGKIESFSALVEIAFLFVACGWIIYEAVNRIVLEEVIVEASFWLFLIMVISIIVDFSRSHVLYRAAGKYGSQALEADALHFSTDMLSSSVVIVGLALVWLSNGWGLGALLKYFEYTPLYPLVRVIGASPLRHADSVAALIVSIIIVLTGFRLGRRAVDVLLDRAPVRARELVEEAVCNVDAVIECRRVRVRSAGSKHFVDVVIAVDPSYPLARTHEIASEAESRVLEILPGSDVMIHVEPAEMEEDVVERIRRVALSRGFKVHSVHTHELNGTLSVDLHLEVPPQMNLDEAHGLADELEELLRKNVERIEEVNVHIEPAGRKTTDSGEAAKLASNPDIKDVVESVVGEGRCHRVTVKEMNGKLDVHVHCKLNGSTPIGKAHRLATEAENEVKRRIPNVEDVNIHLEPE
ncbi:MAG: cation-efflux pump [Candidatus Freyarchaeota archaeon]|nr:cation-efflux pump [Candidatus Jordarchaeia archaeon]